MRWLRFPRILGILVCLYLLGMSALFGVLWSQNRDFVRDAGQVTGTVTALVPRAPVGSTREPGTDDRMRSRAPTVSYEVGGKTYEYTSPHGRYQPRHAVGDRVTVIYDRQDPAVARIRGEGRFLEPVITIGFVLSALLVAALLVRTRRLTGPPAEPGPPRAASGGSDPSPRLSRTG